MEAEPLANVKMEKVDMVKHVASKPAVAKPKYLSSLPRKKTAVSIYFAREMSLDENSNGMVHHCIEYDLIYLQTRRHSLIHYIRIATYLARSSRDDICRR